MLLVVSTIYGFMGLAAEMGLAILAGVLGLAFSNIDKISKFKGAGFEAEMKMVHSIIEDQTEPSPEIKAEAKNETELNQLEKSILHSLKKPGYTWRYARTVASEVTASIHRVEITLSSLKSRGYCKNGKGSNGEIWAATSLGRSLSEQCSIDSKSSSTDNSTKNSNKNVDKKLKA